jgi:predicted RNase H-like nuclease
MKALIDWGIQFPAKTGQFSHDELDAVLAAVTAMLHHQKRTEMIGDARDGYIVIPE